MPRTITRRQPAAVTDEDEDYSPNEPEAAEERPSARRSRTSREDRPSRRGPAREERPSRRGPDREDSPARPSRRARTSGDEEDKPRARFKGRAESEDRPARGDRTRADTSSTAGRGWGAYSKVKAESGGFADTMKVTSEAVIIKFLEPEPFFVFRQHWLDEITEGKRSFVCLGDDCPLCEELNDSPRLQVCFNVVDFADPDAPELKVFIAGSRLAQVIETFAADKKTSPIDREDLFWSISKSGKGTKTSYALVPVKERDLEDWDWKDEDIDAAYDAIDEFLKGALYDESFVSMTSRKELAEIADDILDA